MLGEAGGAAAEAGAGSSSSSIWRTYPSTFPLFKIPCGSSASFSVRISAISALLRVIPSHARFSSPMPCSAETEPLCGTKAV